MWLHVPNMPATDSPCVPELADSNSDCPSPSETDFELSVTSSGKPTQRLLSWRGWQTRPWIKLLFGAISRPSMADRGAAKWISSLEAIPASRSQSPVEDAAQMIRGTCGPTFDALCQKYSQDSASSRTSQTTFDWDLKKSEETYEDLATRLSRESLARRKWARLISESDCSSWPTAKTPSGGSNSKRKERGAGGADLQEAAAQWQTPATDSFRSRGGDRKNEQGLDQQARTWATPSCRDADKWQKKPKRKGQIQLSAQAYSHPVQGIPTDGNMYSKQIRRLNPLFVEWLMGLPRGWTSCGPMEMQSFRLWQRMHSAVLLRVLKHETERPYND